jgi:hypothetical protein
MTNAQTEGSTRALYTAMEVSQGTDPTLDEDEHHRRPIPGSALVVIHKCGARDRESSRILDNYVRDGAPAASPVF